MCCMDFSFIALYSLLLSPCLISSWDIFFKQHTVRLFKGVPFNHQQFIFSLLFGSSIFSKFNSSHFQLFHPNFTSEQRSRKDTTMDRHCHNIWGYFSFFPLSHFPLKHYNGILIQLGQNGASFTEKDTSANGSVNKSTSTGASGTAADQWASKWRL